MENEKFKYFVWVNGLFGPEAQIWFDDGSRDGQGKMKPSLKLIKISENDVRTLDELKRDYPL